MIDEKKVFTNEVSAKNLFDVTFDDEGEADDTKNVVTKDMKEWNPRSEMKVELLADEEYSSRVGEPNWKSNFSLTVQKVTLAQVPWDYHEFLL